MIPFPKIQGIWKRDERGTFIENQWATPELDFLKNNQWIFREKIDGTNIRVGLDGQGGLDIRGRSDNANLHPHLVKAIEGMVDPAKLEAICGPSVILFGEGYGAGIQKVGSEYRPDKSFILFDVVINGCWLRDDDVTDIADKLGLWRVPLLGAGTIREGIDMVLGVHDGGTTMRSFVAATDMEAEGLVLVPGFGARLFELNGSPVRCKIKTVDFRKMGWVA